MSINFDNRDSFAERHIGPSNEEIQEMLRSIGEATLDDLIKKTVPENICSQKELNLSHGLGEYRYLDRLNDIASQNKVSKNYIGLGYYPTVTPSVIARNILENPGWYTAYTPYQAEISQGRLEGLINFQTMTTDLTGMEIANASLLDEGTAAAEAMTMLYRTRSKDQNKAGVKTLFVSNKVFPQTIDILKTRANPLGINLIIGNTKQFNFENPVFGAILQYPEEDGNIEDLTQWVKTANEHNIRVAVATDLMALTLLKPPGEWGAEIAFGNTQRFGIPMGCGGPHAAFFACKESYKRHIPGRIIGISKDRHDNLAYRMALQTREQHIRRESATSNICTAQALLAIMAGMYAVYHGEAGLKEIATRIHAFTKLLDKILKELGITQLNTHYFDTLKLKLPGTAESMIARAESTGLNFRPIDEDHIGISLDETTTLSDLFVIIGLFAEDKGELPEMPNIDELRTEFMPNYPTELQRSSPYLTHPTFKNYKSETKMLRYLKSLENKDLSLTHAMIPLGSCTMKLNAATQMIPLSWPQISRIHPFQPKDQLTGYNQIIEELGNALCAITELDDISFQPNSGAQGEYAGLLAIYRYHQNNDSQRNTVLIPSSAHGTNPASAILAGFEIKPINCDENGNINMDDLKTKIDKIGDNLAGIMITYPSTHGVFEETIVEICDLIHQAGGLVYMDGANMNAQVGLTSPGKVGADVCHLNLHKTFSIPHGGGGPGMGPICVRDILAPYLPGHKISDNTLSQTHWAVSSANWGSASILTISHAYVGLLGKKGCTDATKIAILNANYIKTKLEPHYPILYVGKNGKVAHELIIDCRDFKKSSGITVEDIAKRLIDYGFHAPTMSWPVPETLMIEPTESEDKAEIDRFCDALITIRAEINAIETGASDNLKNPLKNAPHTLQELTQNNWPHPYTREEAAYPLDYLKTKKFWASVARIDSAHGDRNLFCACAPIEGFSQ